MAKQAPFSAAAERCHSFCLQFTTWILRAAQSVALAGDRWGLPRGIEPGFAVKSLWPGEELNLSKVTRKGGNSAARGREESISCLRDEVGGWRGLRLNFQERVASELSCEEWAELTGPSDKAAREEERSDHPQPGVGGPCCSSILYVLLCICKSQTPDLSLLPSFPLW